MPGRRLLRCRPSFPFAFLSFSSGHFVPGMDLYWYTLETFECMLYGKKGPGITSFQSLLISTLVSLFPHILSKRDCLSSHLTMYVGSTCCKGKQMDNRRSFGGPRNYGAPREMTKVVCSDCGKECEVPFKPTEGRPVYCRDCLPKHRKPRF